MYLLRELWAISHSLTLQLVMAIGMHYCSALVKLVKEGYSPVSAVATSVDADFHMPFVGGVVLDNFKK